MISGSKRNGFIADRKQRYDAKRAVEKPWRALYGREWRRLRVKIIARDSSYNAEIGAIVPRCQATGQWLIGKYPAPNSPTVDHIHRHNGDPRLFWDPNNLWTVAKSWHDSTKQSWENVGKKTVGQDGWPIPQQAPRGWVSWDELHQPTDIGPSKPPLTLLFGPPAAGKSTYIKQYARLGDVIIDADIEATRLGLDRYTLNNGERVRILKARNMGLRRLQRSPAPGAWFAGIGGATRIRKHWADYLKPTSIIILTTPADICIERIKASDRTHKDEQIKAVLKWHNEFEPRAGEWIESCRS